MNGSLPSLAPLPERALLRRRMLKCMAAGAGLALAGGAVGASASRSFVSIPKSLWVWRTPLAESAEVLEVVRRFRFDTVFYSIPLAERARLFSGGAEERRAVNAFRQAGVAFQIVAGDANWCRHGERMPRPVQELLAFQARSRLFDGLCLDVEPHTLPDWKQERRDGIVQGYMELLGAIGDRCAGMEFPLAVAVVPLFAQVAAGGRDQSLLQYVAGRARETVMMAYRASPGEALRIAGTALEQLDAGKAPWWFGVSTYLNAKAGVSYAGSTLDAFASAMAELDGQLSRHGSSYRGIAINDYPSLTAILRR